MDVLDSSTRKMFAAYQGGATLAQTGRRFGLSGERVRQIFRGAGLPVRSPREARDLRRTQQAERERAMVERLRESGDLELAAQDFDVRPRRIREVAKRMAPELLAPLGRTEPRVARGYWTRAAIIDAIHEWTSTYGEPPRATDWRPATALRNGQPERAARFSEGLWPHASTVLKRFGRWNDAIYAAGYEPRMKRRANHRRRRARR
jgi:hypothetical protein